jgi:hypothetical protein
MSGRAASPGAGLWADDKWQVRRAARAIGEVATVSDRRRDVPSEHFFREIDA